MATLKNKNNHLKACSTYTYNENHFLVDSRYEIVRVLGKGSYGVVCSAIDTKSSVSESNKDFQQRHPSNQGNTRA